VAHPALNDFVGDASERKPSGVRIAERAKIDRLLGRVIRFEAYAGDLRLFEVRPEVGSEAIVAKGERENEIARLAVLTREHREQLFVNRDRPLSLNRLRCFRRAGTVERLRNRNCAPDEIDV